MHSRKILGIVSAILITTMPSLIFAQKSKGKLSLTVRQQVGIHFGNLKKNLKQENKLKKQFIQITEFRSKMTALRKKSPRQAENDEIEMDLLISGLDNLPSEKEFKKKDCPVYKDKLLRAMSPNADDGEKIDFPTQSSLDVLSLLCK